MTNLTARDLTVSDKAEVPDVEAFINAGYMAEDIRTLAAQYQKVIDERDARIEAQNEEIARLNMVLVNTADVELGLHGEIARLEAECARVPRWNYDLDAAPKDREILMSWDGRTVKAWWLDNLKAKYGPWAGWRTPSNEVTPKGQPYAWMEMPTPATAPLMGEGGKKSFGHVSRVQGNEETFDLDAPNQDGSTAHVICECFDCMARRQKIARDFIPPSCAECHNSHWPSDDCAIYWLVERNSPAEWWVHDLWINGECVGEWTTDASQAQKWTKFGAHDIVEKFKSLGMKGDLRATEHMNMKGPHNDQ